MSLMNKITGSDEESIKEALDELSEKLKKFKEEHGKIGFSEHVIVFIVAMFFFMLTPPFSGFGGFAEAEACADECTKPMIRTSKYAFITMSTLQILVPLWLVAVLF